MFSLDADSLEVHGNFETRIAHALHFEPIHVRPSLFEVVLGDHRDVLAVVSAASARVKSLRSWKPSRKRVFHQTETAAHFCFFQTGAESRKKTSGSITRCKKYI